MSEYLIDDGLNKVEGVNKENLGISQITMGEKSFGELANGTDRTETINFAQDGIKPGLSFTRIPYVFAISNDPTIIVSVILLTTTTCRIRVRNIGDSATKFGVYWIAFEPVEEQS